MKSIPELRTRIGELTSAIESQKRALRDLENQRSKVQSELNSRVDPMARIPFEIVSDIFLHCVSNIPRPDSRTAPLVLLNICRLWRTIAVSTPFLWAEICMDSTPFPRGAKFAKLCRDWIDRARTISLSFSLRGSLARRIELLMNKHAPQVQNLELFVRDTTDLLRLGVPGLFPSLMKLTVGADETSPVEVDFSPGQCIGLLRAAPALLECDFDDVFCADDIFPPGPVVTHTSLRVLRLGNPQSRAFEGYHGNSAFILQYVTLPSLQSLDIADFDITPEVFISFLMRSRPPLTCLRMVLPNTIWEPGTIIEYFQLTPNLTDVELYFTPNDDSDEENGAEPFRPFLEVLNTGTDLLQRLSNITLWALFWEVGDYETIIKVLTARRTSLRSFRLYFPPENYDAAPPGLARNVIVALRQFTEDGIHVHVGPRQHNCLDRNLVAENQ
ncbi:hypothetical protein MSAN_01759000 [Mycena sanguinolenta]|uniref:F-box domain-containing protein n=1 Tax=Mycena sanguinolenta TaxID=230812 RepID=A0A8H6XX77_9AGAR|nr:hypothetical protein MSAN_01759000 [Mycena sanguinolenta]